MAAQQPSYTVTFKNGTVILDILNGRGQQCDVKVDELLQLAGLDRAPILQREYKPEYFEEEEPGTSTANLSDAEADAAVTTEADI